MIYSIQGLIESILSDSLVVSIHGVSLQVNVTDPARFHKGDAVRLFTHLQVREDSFVLFGFNSEEEIFWFRTLLGIPGIGSKTALNILSAFSIDQLIDVIMEDKSEKLTTANGVGQATAKKIVLYMGEKLKKKQGKLVKKDCLYEKAYEEAKYILMDLGLSSKEAIDLLNEPKNEEEKPCKDPQTLVKEALKRRNR